MSGGEQARADFSDGLSHLAAALQRLELTMGGRIEELPVNTMHRLATVLDDVPARNVHQALPPDE
jgi:hypothetical protein